MAVWKAVQLYPKKWQPHIWYIYGPIESNTEKDKKEEKIMKLLKILKSSKSAVVGKWQ
jgi:hypothetical protein